MAIALPNLALATPEPIPQLLRDLVHERTGVYFEADRLDMLLEKLAGRVQLHGCASYLDYYYILKYDERGPDEWRRVMDAFSVPETYFWREYDQIRAFVEQVVPAWFAQPKPGPLRVWSAACATGEEPYSLAIALEEAGFGRHPIEIVASDASETAIQRARTAVYRERSFRALPPLLRERHFEPIEGGHQLKRDLAERVNFRWANLVEGDEIAPLATAQVIFCRNVFIYFSPAAISRVVSCFAQHAAAGSLLFVGAAESLLKLTDEYDLEEIDRAFVYRRKARA